MARTGPTMGARGQAARSEPEQDGDDGTSVDRSEEMSDDELSQLIEDRLKTSMGAPGSQVSQDRMRNLEAVLAEPNGEWAPPDIDDRSSVVSTEAADTVEWMLPSLLRIFAAGRNSIDLTAKRPQFEAGTKVAREALRWLWWDKLDGLTILHNWLKDGLQEKVGFVRVDYCEASETVREKYQGLTAAQAQSLLSEEGVKLLAATPRVENTDQGPVPVYDLELERSHADGFPTVKVIPPEEMRIDNGARYGSEPLFIAQEYRAPRSQLVAEGYPVEDFTGGYDPAAVSDESQARRRINTRFMFDNDDREDDPMLRVVDAYIRRGSEHAPRWIRALKIDDELIERDDACDSHPFGWWCPSPFPHVFFGGCPVDQAIEPQRLRTRLMRAIEDNVYLTVNGRTGVVGSDPDTIDDILDSRPGGIVRLKDKDALVPITQPDMSAAAYQALEFAEQWAERRTGFSRLSKGLSSEAINDTATGVLEITERADMRTELIARHAASALEKVLSKVMRVWARHQDVSQWVRIAGQWVDVDPREWDRHYTISVRVGLGSGNRDRQAAQLTQLGGIQAGMVQAGIVPPPAQVALARKLTEAMGFDGPEQFFPDPPPPNPNQPPPLPIMVEQIKAQSAQSLEQVRLQAKLQETQASLEMQASNDRRDLMRAQHEAELRAHLEAAKQAAEAETARMRDATERFRIELEAQVKLQIAAMQQQAAQPPQIDLSGLQRMEEAMQMLMQAVTAPKRLIRDPATGRAVGAEVVLPNTKQRKEA